MQQDKKYITHAFHPTLPQSHQPVKKNYINHFYPFLKFTWKISETYMSFLDSLISINGDALTTSVFISQPIHTFANLFSSSQSNHSAPLVTLNSCLTLNYCVFPAFNAFPKTLGPNLRKGSQPFLSNMAIQPIQQTTRFRKLSVFPVRTLLEVTDNIINRVIFTFLKMTLG